MLAIIFLLFSQFSTLATADGPDGFQAGLRLMQEQKFDEATKQFEAEFHGGKNFAALFFNWGLSAYRLDKKGLSAALWRRALFLDPELRPAQQALAYISNELPSQNTSYNLSGWPALRATVLDRVTLNKLLGLCWIFFLAAGILLIRHWGKYRRAIKDTSPLPKIPVVGISLALALVLIFALSVAKGITLFETRATVISNSVPLRTGPSVDDNSIFDLVEGFDVVVHRVQNSWALITVTTGVTGWVPTETLFQHTGKNKLW